MTIDDLRTELDQALTSAAWNDAAELQHTILILLDRLQTHDLRDRDARRETFQRMADQNGKPCLDVPVKGGRWSLGRPVHGLCRKLSEIQFEVWMR